ncbi:MULTISPECIES: hypothetical protein [unclassified Carboxydocella]|uniref:hypothetical protein n=1 Tax=unclassified Carboxydocella TaxID=2685367 RepID=UPI0009ABF0E9|nr:MULTISPECIES: hypothetical protein [unclassified Carboxydocella]AVX31051.1 hypothetical protein CTH_1461 [Carboxydocella thermautotrophica]GAW27951.1 hypothetical protein ULO1_05210 [Carboxydocella sp. ULO1]GAW31557.1 hypothetical protein JDF658_13220 [Carboxydocella sp. JDF658]
MSNKVNVNNLPPLDVEVKNVMKSEFNLAFWLSVIYFIFLFAVPVLNWTAPALMKTRIWGGMSLTWFLTSIFAMILAFLIAAVHVYFYQNKFGADIEETRTRREVFH